MATMHYYGPVDDPALKARGYLKDDLLPLLQKHERAASVAYQQARGEGPTFKEIDPKDIMPGWFAQQQAVAAAHHAIYRFYRDLLLMQPGVANG